MESVSQFFRENLPAVSKEQLLNALETALQSADHWRIAFLSGCFPSAFGRCPSNLQPQEKALETLDECRQLMAEAL